MVNQGAAPVYARGSVQADVDDRHG